MTPPKIGECWYLPVVIVQVNTERALVHLLTPDDKGELPTAKGPNGREYGLPITVPVEYLKSEEEVKP